VKTVETDGYEAVQLAFAPVAERKITKAEVGHLKKGGVDPHRHLVEFRGQSQPRRRRLGHRRGVRARRTRSRSPGSGSARASPGRSSAHKFHRGPKTHGSHNIRKPGSIGASATPSRVFKGMKMAGRLGGKRVTQVGLHVHDVDTEQNLLLVKGAVPGPKNGIVEIREEKAHTRHHRSD